MKAFLNGFRFAARGVLLCLNERNFRFHLCAAAFVIFFGACFYDFSGAEWAVLMLTIGLVISLEAVNTALEQLCNRVTDKRDEFIRSCKDCAAGAVLIAAVAAVAVGVSLFRNTERFAEIFQFYTADLWRLVSLAVMIAAAVFVVFLPEKFKKK